MTDAISSPAPTPPPARSRLWVTLVWVAAAALAFVAANVLGLFGYFAWHAHVLPHMPISLPQLVESGSAVGISTAIASPLLIGFFIAAARMNSTDWIDYLGLRWPSRGQWGVGMAIGLALFLLEAGFEQVFPDARAADFMTGTYMSARADGTLAALIAAVVVLAPISEELAFRGFFYARLERRLGVAAAILLTAAAWSCLHVQYGWSSIGEIAVLGLMLGGLRWYTGSTVLTIVLHGAWNAAGLVQVALSTGHG